MANNDIHRKAAGMIRTIMRQRPAGEDPNKPAEPAAPQEPATPAPAEPAKQ